MPFVESDGLKIAYDDSGSGEPALLFMPGWCAGRGAFDIVSSLTSKTRRTLAMDWRSHGGSSKATRDFGAAQLVQDALAVIQASGAGSVVPVVTAHAGWEAIELRRHLNEKIPKIVLVDWIVTAAPPPFLAGLAAMKDQAQALKVRDELFAMWTEGVSHPEVLRFVREDMGSYDAAMWARAGREIEKAYAREGSPFQALEKLQPPVPVLHLYCQPTDPGFLAVQEDYARTHPWFGVKRLDGLSHFPTIEVPDQVAEAVERFLIAG